MRARTLGKDVENQQRPIHHAATEDLLHRPLRVGRQLVVDDDQVSLLLDGDVARFLQLASSEVGTRVGVLEPLRQSPDDLGPGGASQLLELVERLGDRPRCRARVGSQQQRSFGPCPSEAV